MHFEIFKVIGSRTRFVQIQSDNLAKIFENPPGAEMRGRKYLKEISEAQKETDKEWYELIKR